MDQGKVVLQNERARLEALTPVNYPCLREIAREPGLIRYSPGVLTTPEGFEAYFQKALRETQEGTSQVFLIYDREAGQWAGTSRFMRIDARNRVVEIGSTWIGSRFQGTGLNCAVKSLMLDAAFGPMGFERVEFRIDERNIRSRKAVEKLGARLEGVFRKNVYLDDGFKRNTCVYGLLQHEWTGGNPNR
ncbi:MULTISPECIES: GNAT family N-acetyltransferase [unclassified Robiginitalea]|uniref:GNAT family N-acetyltransferase n=1 Tax=Robiginitalea TaxID=252306 RepID=UPI00234ABD8C|nr:MULTISPECIES: GNAT family protein [unclassified Robiginitalea]MDC6354222.1 GNAT family protein [Robiginitalea sp. PM2]MDC6374489.1 GNAT family protein [Robiginitalea sp. SP8]